MRFMMIVKASKDSEAGVLPKRELIEQMGKFNQQVGGVYDNKTPLDAWAKLAHALFQANEAMFYN